MVFFLFTLSQNDIANLKNEIEKRQKDGAITGAADESNEVVAAATTSSADSPESGVVTPSQKGGAAVKASTAAVAADKAAEVSSWIGGARQ